MKNKIFSLTVLKDYHVGRIDKFLQSQLNNLSRTRLQNLIKEGCVKLNDNTTFESSKKIKKLDIIKINFPEPKETSIKANKIPLDILYDNNDIIITMGAGNIWREIDEESSHHRSWNFRFIYCKFI